MAGNGWDIVSANEAANNPTQQSYALAFLDVESAEAGAINELHASLIVHTLLTAKRNNENVVVHCEAGISRSGAVAQFAIDCLGFEDEVPADTEEGKQWRKPNKLVLAILEQQSNFASKLEYTWNDLVQEAKRIGLEFPLSANGFTILVNHVLVKNSNA